MPTYSISAKSSRGSEESWREEFLSMEHARVALGRRGWFPTNIEEVDPNKPPPSEANRLHAEVELARKSGDWSSVSIDAVAHAATDIVLTTAQSVAGRDIEHELGIVSAECVYAGRRFFSFGATSPP